MDTALAIFALICLFAIILTIVVCFLWLSFILLSPIYCTPYWLYRMNKRCDGWYKLNEGIWYDVKKATYIYYCWITHKKTPED